MHDIDRTFLEYTPEMETFEAEQFEFGAAEAAGAPNEVFGEAELTELAAELLEVTNEGELSHFLGNLISRAAGAVGQGLKSPVGQALGGILKNTARQALPMVGSALGGSLGGATGARLGGQLGAGAARLFGLETEGLSHEDEAFEVAKQYVRFAADAVKHAATAAGTDPRAIAQTAATLAAQRHAPGLLAGSGTVLPVRARQGRWVRRGNQIILFGV